MKSITKAIASIVFVASATSLALAAPKDITTRTNPDGSLNVEARYTVHVGFSAYNGGLTSAVDSRSRGLMEYHSSGGNSGNWGRINNGITALAADGNFTCNTFGGINPDYAGFLFNCSAKVTKVKFWNRTNGDGGTFAATPEVQYLDAPDPIGTWHTIPAVTWDTPYNPDFLPANSVRPYEITIDEPLSNVWGIRLIGDGNPAGAVPADQTGWVGFQELAVEGELEIGETDLSRNKARTGVAIAITEQGAGTTPRLNDGLFVDSMQTWSGWPWYMEDYLGIEWATPQNRVNALGIALRSFTDGGIFDDCQVPLRIEYKTSASSDWIPVTGLDKRRYPYVWQRLTYLGGAQAGFLFSFDEVSDITGLRIIGDPHGFAGNDRDGFLGAYELEVFGVPVLAEQADFDDNGYIDGNDMALFERVLPEGPVCALGPEIPIDPACADRDLDNDGDVDQDDFGVLQRCYSGSLPLDPFCE